MKYITLLHAYPRVNNFQMVKTIQENCNIFISIKTNFQYLIRIKYLNDKLFYIILY